MDKNFKHFIKTLINVPQFLDQILTQTITSSLLPSIPKLNAIIRAYSKSPKPIKSILIYNHHIRKQTLTTSPDHYTYPPLFKSCSRIPSLPKGKELHAHLVKLGLHHDVYTQNAVLHFYGSMAEIDDARQVFDEMPNSDIVSWNSMLNVYNENSRNWGEMLNLFRRLMDEKNVKPDRITLMIMFSMCSRVNLISYGGSIHGCLIKMGFEYIVKLENSLLGMYIRCRDIHAALRVYNEIGSGRDVVSSTVLINGYAETGLVDSARNVFDRTDSKDVGLWNAMIRAYVKCNKPNDALKLYERMVVRPDENTLVSVIAACAGLTDLRYGRTVHRFILNQNMVHDVFIGTALIDMYSKCWCLETALITFFKMTKKDVYTWTAMIEGLAINGHDNEALKMFNRMQTHGVKPNGATFVSLLMSCSRSGQLDEGCELFVKMVRDYGLEPKTEHFGCLVHMLSRAGLLHQAERFIEMMSVEDRVVAYKMLLNACISYSEFELGENVANEMSKIGSRKRDVATEILVSNFYAIAGRWSKVVETRNRVKDLFMSKQPGISSVELTS